jgi:hypothetical protein
MDVYFVQSTAGPIKIGFTCHLAKRIANLNGMLPEGVSLMASLPGDRRTEAYFHTKLASYRIQGEWFRPADAVLLAVEDVKNRGLESVPAAYRAAATLPTMKRRELDVIASAAQFLQALTDPRPPTETIGQSVRRVAREVGISPRTAKSIWYREVSDISAGVYLTLKEAFDAKVARTLRGEDQS